MKKLGKLIVVLTALFVFWAFLEAGKAQKTHKAQEQENGCWKYDTAVMVGNLKTADRYYTTPVNLSEDRLETEMALVWTDYGRAFHEKSGVKATLLFVEIDSFKGIFRVESSWDIGFNDNIISKEIWPFGEDTWLPMTRDKTDSSKVGHGIEL
jgi:hypothetical protein